MSSGIISPAHLKHWIPKISNPCRASLGPNGCMPGRIITAMGSDLAGKQESEAGVLGKADRVVCGRRSQSFSMGELQHRLGAGVISDESAIDELGSITCGRVKGRASEDEITVCDLTGTGVEDTAIATLALARARELGLGVLVQG